jgi:ribosomal protein L24E
MQRTDQRGQDIFMIFDYSIMDEPSMSQIMHFCRKKCRSIRAIILQRTHTTFFFIFFCNTREVTLVNVSRFEVSPCLWKHVTSSSWLTLAYNTCWSKYFHEKITVTILILQSNYSLINYYSKLDKLDRKLFRKPSICKWVKDYCC